MQATPAEYVRATKEAIARVRGLDVTDIAVYVPWQVYKQYLIYKGITWEPRNPEGLDQVEDLPIKEIGGHRIHMSSRHAPQVLGRRADGGLTGYAIVIREYHDQA